jgi:hypothetical protein
MRVVKFKIQLMMMLVLLMSLAFITPGFTQYDPDQLNIVIQQLKAKKLLTNLVELTQIDNKQAATRADLIMACYVVIRHLEENADLNELNQKLSKLQNSVANLEKRGVGKGRSIPEDSLVQRVLAKVEQNLDNREVNENVTQELKHLRENFVSIKKDITAEQSQRIENLEKKQIHTMIIASAAVIVSMAITIVAAR